MYNIKKPTPSPWVSLESYHERGSRASVFRPPWGIYTIPLAGSHYPILHCCHDSTSTSSLLPAVLLHHQNLHHTDKDVDKVKLKRNALVDSILANDAALGKTGVVQNLLDVVEGEAAKDSETAVQRDALGQGEGADGGDGQQHRREAGGDDDAEASEEGPADVEVLVLLGGGTDDGEGAHHGDGVETGTGEKGTGNHCQERGDHGGLGCVEGGPHGVLGDVAVDALVFTTRILKMCSWLTCQERWHGYRTWYRS